jgi:hypothetical protein
MKRMLVLLAAVLAGGIVPAPLGAMGFCAPPDTRTLRDKAADAALILCGRLVNKTTVGGEEVKLEFSDCVVEKVVRWHPILGDQRRISLSRYIETGAPDTTWWILFFDVSRGQVDLIAGHLDPSGEIPGYLKKALALPAGDRARCVRFFFSHLDHANKTIAEDARRELARVDPADLRVVGPTLPADRIARSLAAAGLSPARVGLFARLLGYCGTKKHAEVLRNLLENPAQQTGPGVADLLSAYVILNPKEGWAHLRGIFKDGRKDCPYRLGALRAACFLWDNHPDLVSHRDLAEAVAAMLDYPDVADLVVDNLREWKCWDMADRVLALQSKKYDELVRRAVLRFALCCPGNPAAERHVAEQRLKDADLVSDFEEQQTLTGALPDR